MVVGAGTLHALERDGFVASFSFLRLSRDHKEGKQGKQGGANYRTVKIEA